MANLSRSCSTGNSWTHGNGSRFILRKHLAPEEHGVAVGDENSGAQAVAAAPWALAQNRQTVGLSQLQLCTGSVERTTDVRHRESDVIGRCPDLSGSETRFGFFSPEVNKN
jgi:hypothetical protein